MAEKLEWMSKIRACLEPPGKGGSAKDSSIKNSTVFDSSLSRSTSTDSSVVSVKKTALVDIISLYQVWILLEGYYSLLQNFFLFF